jgi:DNA-binding transcriptional ArsR family regulator
VGYTRKVLTEVLRQLANIGVVAEMVENESTRLPGIRPDAVVDIQNGPTTARFVVEERQRTPYRNEIARLAGVHDALIRQGQPLLSVPFVTESLGPLLTEAGWSWADDHGNFDLRAPGLVIRQRRTATPPKPTQRLLPKGSGSFSIIRALIRFGSADEEEPKATALAAQAGVSQPRVSQVLGQLQELGLVERSEGKRWRPDRAALLDRFLGEYPGPGGTEKFFYGLDSPSDVALRAAQRVPRGAFAISADVGPDLVAPWRRPSLVIIYTTHDISASELGIVEAQGRHDANVIMRMPKDRSVFPVPEIVAEVSKVEVPLADPTQMIWDLQQLGGADRLEATGYLREWLLRRP